VTGEVTQVMDSGIEVKIAETDLTAFIRRAELSRERSEQRPDRFAPGEKVDARVTNIDKKSRKISLSIKALEIAEEKEAVAQYGSTDSGASLGDILGAALKKQHDDGDGAAETKAAASEADDDGAADEAASNETAAAEDAGEAEQPE
jgi:small subunit ribosomal protein S1